MNKEYEMKELGSKDPLKRDSSIDILKCLAVLAITNSHMGLAYGKFAFLATGGAIGDALFFFCSGYTLFLGPKRDFFNWYKRRINRIYPTIFTWSVFLALFFDLHYDMPNILLRGGHWFVSCIMIYYIILWFVRQYAIKLFWLVFLFVISLIVVWYFVFGIDDVGNNIYGYCYFKWVHYFLFMLLGAVKGLHNHVCRSEIRLPCFKKTIIQLSICVALFYFLCWFKQFDGMAFDFLQIFSLAPLSCICLLLYRLCNTELLTIAYNHKYIGRLIRFIGGLCLEIYLVQCALIKLKLNLILLLLCIILGAYILRCLARIWRQIFSENNFKWGEIVKFY